MLQELEGTAGQSDKTHTMTKKRTMLQRLVFQGKRRWLLVGFLAFSSVPAFGLYNSLALQDCAVTDAPTATNQRNISLTMTNCSDVSYFRISESPDFGKSTGPRVDIKNIAADNSYADISVTYPGGTIDDLGSITNLVKPRSLKVLAVLFTFEDNEGQIAGIGQYQTPTWLKRLVFGDGVVGPDGYFKNNSIKDYVFQSTSGHVNLTGEVYPVVVKLPLEKYRDFLGKTSTPATINLDILKKIEASNPGFLSSKNFDFLLGVSSEQYPVYRSLYESSAANIGDGQFGSIRASLTYSIPVDASRSVLGKTITETRTSYDASTVVTRYNPDTVDGVWLESDTNKTGKNYYTGGSVDATTNTRYRYIRLGTALPDASTRVVVTYKSSGASTANNVGDSKLLLGAWYPHLTHELMHEFSKLPAFRFSSRNFLGDLYQQPSQVDAFDVMASGDESSNHPLYTVPYYEPSLFSAPTKVMHGYVDPFTLEYNKSRSSIRLYRSEISSLNEGDRVTAIKIPLTAYGDEGLEKQVIDSTAKQFRGEDYLLLEWRTKNDLPSGMHNFDRNLKSEGLVIYHVIGAEQYELTGNGSDIVRVIDATDSSGFSGSYSDTSDSPAAFGPQSGVMSYTAGDFWQEKSPTASTETVDYLLSEGSGTKTMYISYADANGKVVNSQQITTTLSSNETAQDRLPHVSLNISDGAIIASNKTITANYTAPNGPKNIRFYVDDMLKWERNEAVINPTSEGMYVRPTDYKNGTHKLSVVFVDGGLYTTKVDVSFLIQNGDSTAPQVRFVSPQSAASVNEQASVDIDAADNIAVTKVELYADGVVVGTDTAEPYTFRWDTSYVPNGLHQLTVKAYDAAGNIGVSEVQVSVANVDRTPPTIPSDVVASIDGPTAISLSWGSSSDASAVTYDVYRDGVKLTTQSGLVYTDSAISSGTLYEYFVVARDAFGNKSDESNHVVIASIPTKPSGLVLTVLSPQSIGLHWDAPTGTAPVDYYDIYRNSVKVATSKTTDYTDTNLLPGTSYTYFITAHDAADSTSEPSASVTTTTSSDVVVLGGTIAGKVTNKNGAGLANVTVKITINKKKYAYKTNTSGKYTIRYVPEGSYAISYSKTGFVTKNLSTKVIDNKTTTKNVTLLKK